MTNPIPDTVLTFFVGFALGSLLTVFILLAAINLPVS